ncbi:Glycine betaine/choline OpuC ABC transporter, periplasmic substrate-binding protein [Pseudomonas syringae pv. tomato]|nr:Glycine betaine/choline OpuC ABC transporter, periplasmic substrate-binding protein [Pseudomonas syringae pv. tomato]RMP68352.1 Glycine betaine/choline OpuC ABC transporter, periplasmic substrate-binding protein [Pseudomonas syringae pv. berberidis]
MACRIAQRCADHYWWRACRAGDQRRDRAAGVSHRCQQPRQPDFPGHCLEQPAATGAGRGVYRAAGAAARWPGDTGQSSLAGTRTGSLSEGILMKKICLFLGFALLFPAFAQAAEKPLLRVGARVFTEQTMLAELTAQYLRTKNYDVQITGGLGSNLARSAQESGQLDLLWEYTGVSLVAYNHIDEKLDSAQTYARVKEVDAKKGLVWLSPSKFNNTYALALPQKIADKYPQVNTMTDLTKVLKDEAKEGHLVALDTEFANRSDGLVGMVKHYGMNLGRENTRQMDSGLVYTALQNGQVFAGLVYTTDGRLNAFKLKVLEDDKHYFPDYTAAPVIRQEYLDKHPDIATLLKPLAELLDNQTMIDLNARVDVGHESPSSVAADFLRQHPLN